jgi:dipeptidyl aminopeptidase/acylaminoacyl peptidase
VLDQPRHALVNEMVGEGSHLRDGSPLQNAARIKVLVLLFHGTLDRNVGYKQSERMAAALTAAHAQVDHPRGSISIIDSRIPKSARRC